MPEEATEPGLAEMGGSGTPLPDDPGALLALGDAARDARRWAEAGRAYAAFLERNPDDRGILVQRGHCLKEAGDPAAALALYRRAEALEAGDADIHLQIGHALKLLGRRGAAAEAYGRAVVLDPGGRDGWVEWIAIRDSLPAPRAAGMLLDLSDLVAWFVRRRAPSGIQRVQAEIAAAGAAMLGAMHPEEGVWRALPAPLFRRLHHLSRTGADAEEPAWREAVDVLVAWRRRGHALRPGAGTTLVTLGSAWWLPGHAGAVRAAREAGARHVPVLHDAGPLVLPDLTPASTRAEFGRWFAALPALADGVVAVSQATAAEYRRLMARHLPGWPVPPVLVVTPDGRTGDGDAAPPAAAPPIAGGLARAIGLGRRWPAAPAPPARPATPEVPDGPFVLMVSSFEPRKNHLLALEAWRILIRRRGAAGTPRLVLAGRRAPGDGPVMEALAADPALSAGVTVLHAVDDAALARLYRGCLFTLYPSRHEGWGLPVSESLLHRRVPLVSEIPSLMESGRQGAVFFTPGSADELATAAEALIADPARLAALEARIPPHGGLRPWSEVADALRLAVRRLEAGDPARRPPSPPWCEPIRLGHGGSQGPDAALALAAMLMRGGGWHPAEDWGVWTRPVRAALELPAPGEGTARVSLALRSPPGAGGTLRVTLERDGAAGAVDRGAAVHGAALHVAAEHPAGVEEVALEIGPGGPALRLVLEALPGTALPGPGGSGPEAGREVGVGVVAVAVMRGASPADRLAYLERRILVPVRQG